MVTIIDIDAREVRRGFDAILDRDGHRSRAFFEEARKPAKADIRGHQKARKAPDGRSWPGRAPSTRERAAYDGTKRPRARKRRYGKRRKSASGALLGQLPGGSKSQIDRDGLVLSWPAGFAEAHDQGATVGHGAQLPARPFLGWSQGFLRDMHEEWAAYVVQAWEGKR